MMNDPLVRDGQGHTREDIVFSAYVFLGSLVGMVLVLALAVLVNWLW